MSQRVFLGGGPEGLLVFRACFGGACVVGSWSWSPGLVCLAALVLHVFCECFASQSERERERER